MFPDVGEFNLVVAGLATFAATVGYACSRRLSTSSTSQRPEPHMFRPTPTPMQTDSDMQVDIDNDVKLVEEEKESTVMEHDGAMPPSLPLINNAPTATISDSTLRATTPPAPARRLSLKRKVPDDGFDEPKVEDRGYPYNLANIYPNKRSKTPSTDSDVSTPTTSSQITRAPSPALESTVDNTFDAVVVSHTPISQESPATDIAPTPATEPPTSPSPVPDAVNDAQEAETTPARALSPTTLAAPQCTPAPPSPAVTPVLLPNDVPCDISKETQSEKPSLPRALSFIGQNDANSRPSTPKPFMSTGFGAFANSDTFGAPRPTTPKSAFTSPSSGFAAFAGAASPFAAAAALNKTPVAPSLFGSSKSFFRTGHKTTTTSVPLPAPNIFGPPLGGGASNIFGPTSASANIFGKDVKPTDLRAAEKSLDDLVELPKTTENDALKDPNGTTENDQDKEEREKEEREREQREKEESEKEEARRAARAKEEEEVRLQEAREKRLRREAKTRERETGHAIVEARATDVHPTEKFTPVTGEEDEDVELEQKGVRLFIKRGDRSFSEGIPGLIKVLSHRKTGEERILFRREPLLKVSMNVRVQPTVRITFVPEENVLRCILKESISAADAEDGVAKQELAIYVIKPGRSCPKQDFKTFAEGLTQRSQLKDGAEKKTRSA
ncbi:hypothetical protein BDN70DRAFT_132445 [Pholiota conissans]|uniref:RanBD1 domain-containing protein n=1 Tax=Pholiota conissans TaxID=109636 RepID=A0A9P6CRI9_9AGAR|nr:hypothetical protein BDN70DRAFT_132445 [Pholiota conissans]